MSLIDGRSTAAALQTQSLDLGNTALLHPLDGLSAQAKRDFFIGKSFFHSNWVVAPATTTARAGLGPYFNARACGGCHIGNGRGTLPPAERIEAPAALVIRLSRPSQDGHGSPLPEPTYGAELSAFAIRGVALEGKAVITHRLIDGFYADGELYTLRQPQVEITALSHGSLARGVRIGPRFAPPIAGVGLLSVVADGDIEAEAERQARSAGPIKGKVNRVWNPLSSRVELGRFGWKANVADVTQQTVTAFLTDMGITSTFHTSQNCSAREHDCNTAPIGSTPEIDDATLARVITYVALLAAPPRSPLSRDARRGEILFDRFTCASCHKSEYRASRSPPAISRQLPVSRYPPSVAGMSIHAYTDLLLHDMGNGLADARREFLATETQWRTPPLWGIGLTARITGSEAYLHDGRARTLAEAVLWHGGEAHAAREMFLQASAADRAALIDFLRSL